MADWSAHAQLAMQDLAAWASLPVIPTWSRLEPLTLTRGDLTPGAQTLLADPLWLLGRQWQFDELRGEDAGSPITATVEGEIAPLRRLHAGLPGEDPASVAVDLPVPGTLDAPPLEALVEAEVPRVLPLRLRMQTGLHLLRLLRAAGLGTAAEAAASLWPVRHEEAAAPGGGVLSDPVGVARARLAGGRVPDGAAALAELSSLEDGAGGLLEVPAALTATGADQAALRQVLRAWLDWATGFLLAPAGSAWNPHRLEHAFLAQARLSDGPVTMRVEEYTGGTLDWFHGDLSDGPDLGQPAPANGGGADPGSGDARPFTDTTLPAPVRFAGMPADRLFQFEDAAVYLGGLQAGRTDLARLAVVEFALAYGVDWFQIPLDLPYGSVTRIDRVRVVDTFGVVAFARPSRETTRPGWTAFQSTPVQDGSRLADMFVLAPTAPGVLEGTPLEEVVLMRDEMANLVWGVERIVPGPSSGEAVPRAQQAARVSLRQPVPADLDEAKIVYRLMTSVPENWMPFVAVRDRPADEDARHVLERRPMLRYLEDGTAELVNPLGSILLTAPGADPAVDRLRLAEEEVPRDGVVVTRTFQQARTEGGGTVLWVGRRVRTGRGEGASGLRFDTALPPGGLA